MIYPYRGRHVEVLLVTVANYHGVSVSTVKRIKRQHAEEGPSQYVLVNEYLAQKHSPPIRTVHCVRCGEVVSDSEWEHYCQSCGEFHERQDAERELKLQQENEHKRIELWKRTHCHYCDALIPEWTKDCNGCCPESKRQLRDTSDVRPRRCFGWNLRFLGDNRSDEEIDRDNIANQVEEIMKLKAIFYKQCSLPKGAAPVMPVYPMSSKEWRERCLGNSNDPLCYRPKICDHMPYPTDILTAWNPFKDLNSGQLPVPPSPRSLQV